MLYNNSSNSILIQSNIDIVLDVNTNTSNDFTGPSIEIYHNNSQISNGSTIFPPYKLKIRLSDNLPINLTGISP